MAIAIIKETDPTRVFIMYLGAIGTALGTLITITLIFNLIYNYYHLFYKRNSAQHMYKTAYIMIIAYLFTLLLECIFFGSIRTNIFTGVSGNNYTAPQCSTGTILFWITYTIGYTLLNLIFLYRIKVVFEGSHYAYKSYIYILLLVGIALFFVLLLVVITVRHIGQQQWIVYDSGLSICWLASEDTDIFVSIIGGILGLTYFIINIALLYMFIRGLCLLKRQMINNIVASQIADGVSVSGNSSVSLETITNEASKSPISNIVNDDRIKEIIQLHSIIKKQSILVIISIISTISFAAISSIDSRCISLYGLDGMINAVCSWLMVHTSSKYWLYCTKKGVCKCCYRNNVS